MLSVGTRKIVTGTLTLNIAVGMTFDHVSSAQAPVLCVYLQSLSVSTGGWPGLALHGQPVLVQVLSRKWCSMCTKATHIFSHIR